MAGARALVDAGVNSVEGLREANESNCIDWCALADMAHVVRIRLQLARWRPGILEA